MGILNLTPDSFYDGGKYFSPDHAIKKAIKLQSEGADILDIGAESSRPGSDTISIDEEKERLIPVMNALKESINIPVSIDSSRSEVIESAIKTGMICMINDIYACRRDEKIIDIVADSGLYIVIMHMQNSPRTMQNNPMYDNVIDSILSFFQERIDLFRKRGIKENQIILDPGLGFGKRLEDNISIIKNIDRFRSFGYPVLLGPSRKSFIGAITGSEPEERLCGTAAVISNVARHGVDIIRVHDVKEMNDVIKITKALEYNEH
ncbi:MAG: dihydropteroate synthase [Candidatus Aureabacteria bacterium]|nr:dihydropteroate synthase [Candidatus Auribacterota bacterium]